MVNIIKISNWWICYITFHFDCLSIQSQYEQPTNYRKLKTIDLSQMLYTTNRNKQLYGCTYIQLLHFCVVKIFIVLLK